MSSLSDLLPAGGGGKNVDFVASGVLPNGQAVVLKSNGQVEAVAETAISEDLSNTAVIFREAAIVNPHVAYDPNTANKLVVVYSDNGNSGYPTAVVGTVSGTTISFGTAVVAVSTQAQQLALDFDPSNSGKFGFVYSKGGAGAGTAIVGTVSGTGISFGTEATYDAGYCDYNQISFDPNNAGKCVIVFKDGGDNSRCKAVVGTVSGTTMSFGTVVVTANEGSWTDVSFDPNTANKCVLTYKNHGNSYRGTARVGTVSGTSISLGSEAIFNTGNSAYNSISFDKNTPNKFVVGYQDGGNSEYGTAAIGTVSGTSLSFGSEYIFNSAPVQYVDVAFDPSQANKFVAVYKDEYGSSSNCATVIVGTVSGTSISFGTEVALSSTAVTTTLLAFDPNTAGKFVVVYRNNGNSSYGTSNVGQVAASATNLTSTNFLGISDAAVASGAAGKVTIKGGLKTELAGGTFAVTVANPGSGNRYYINGVLQYTLNLREGFTYKFDQSASSNSGHPFRFSTTSNGSHASGSEYTTGVTTSGTPGNAGAYTQIVVAASAPTLYYYCTNHSGMGGTANTLAAIVPNSVYYVQSDGTLSTTTTSPAVRIGKALSSTSINLEFNS